MTNNIELLQYDNEQLRRIAEQQLSHHLTATEDSSDRLDQEDIRRLLHELQVHQIELELQNEELRANHQRQLGLYTELKQSQEKFYQLYHDAPVGYVTLDASGIVLQANHTLATMVGREIHLIEGRHFITLLSKEDHVQFHHRFNAFFKHPEGKQMELRLLSKDGEPYYVLFRGGIPRDTLLKGNAKITETATNIPTQSKSIKSTKSIGVHFTLTNINERKLVEERLHLEQSKLEGIISGTSEGFWQMGIDRRIVKVNKALCNMLGYQPEEMIGRFPWDFTDHNNANIFLQQTSNTHTTNHRTYEIELRTKGGASIPTLFNASTLYNAQDGMEAAFAFVTNISKQKQYEASLIAARQAAEAANIAKSDFLANMSHELRTPLNAVLGYAQILQHDTSLGEMQRDGIITIKRSGEHLLTLINDLLDLSKIEAGRLELFHNEFNITQFFNEIRDLFLVRAMEKGLDFHYQLKSKLPRHVKMDETRLRQVCINLLGNAIKFTQRGEIRLEISYQHGILIFNVKDTGNGIPYTMHEQVFQSFVQAGDNIYRQQGTGLGLAISNRLITLMGGSIALESTEHKGSCFTVRVPIEIVDDIPLTNFTDKIQYVIGLRRIDNITVPFNVLVVDDIVNNRLVLRGLLEPLGFKVTEAIDGESALKLTQNQSFDMIFMDLIMPNMDGLTATRHIINRNSTNKLIVAVTAKAFNEDRLACINAGCKAHLSKPISRSELLRILETYLPLEWQYSTSLISGNENASTDNIGKYIPFNSTHIKQMTKMLDIGDMGALTKYIENILTMPNSPTQATILLKLVQDFRLNDIQQLLDANHDKN